MKGMASTLSSPGFYRFAGKVGRWVIKHFPFMVNNKLNAWYKHRDMPVPPKESFGEWYKKNRK
jgi:L-lactate dehydrogenase complex protein LldF